MNGAMSKGGTPNQFSRRKGQSEGVGQGVMGGGVRKIFFNQMPLGDQRREGIRALANNKEGRNTTGISPED